MAAVDVQPAHVRAGRDQRLAELDLLLVRQLRRARLHVERRHARAREQLDVAAPPTTRPGGRTSPRAAPRRAGSPSSTPGGCTAGPARGRRAPPRPRRLPRAASARSWPRPGRRRSAGSRPCALVMAPPYKPARAVAHDASPWAARSSQGHRVKSQPIDAMIASPGLQSGGHMAGTEDTPSPDGDEPDPRAS